MKEEKVFKFKMDEFPIYIWYFKDENDDGVEVTHENSEEIAKDADISPAVLGMMLNLADTIQEKFDALKQDMIDLYKKAERTE